MNAISVFHSLTSLPIHSTGSWRTQAEQFEHTVRSWNKFLQNSVSMLNIQGPLEINVCDNTLKTT